MKYYKFRYIATYNKEYTIEANSEEEAQSLLDSFVKLDYFSQDIDEQAMESGDYSCEHHFEEEVNEKYYTHFDKKGNLI